MREGGHLEQYADPSTLLSAPATDFVADFVGSERTLRRLSVLHLAPEALVQWPTAPNADAGAAAAAFDASDAEWLLVAGAEPRWLRHGASDAVPAATVDVGTSLADALAVYLAGEGPGVVVTDDGEALGVATGSGLLAAARRPSARR
jgi:osmoprotectant transport system ATP-binding protein